MENELVQELWGCGGAAGSGEQAGMGSRVQRVCAPSAGCSGVAGQAGGSWGMCQGLAGTEAFVSPALCLSLLSKLSLSHQTEMSGNIQSPSGAADIALVSPVGGGTN